MQGEKFSYLIHDLTNIPGSSLNGMPKGKRPGGSLSAEASVEITGADSNGHKKSSRFSTMEGVCLYALEDRSEGRSLSFQTSKDLGKRNRKSCLTSGDSDLGQAHLYR